MAHNNIAADHNSVRRLAQGYDGPQWRSDAMASSLNPEAAKAAAGQVVLHAMSPADGEAEQAAVALSRSLGENGVSPAKCARRMGEITGRDPSK